MEADAPLTHQDALALKTSLGQLESCLSLALESQGKQAINALDSAHDIVADLYEWQAAAPMPDLQAPLARIARFITQCAGSLYRDGQLDQLDEAQLQRFISRHGKSLLALDGVGPATARQLFQHGIFEAEQLYALSPEEIDRITPNSTTRSRLKALPTQDHQAGN
ncbi:helix-hairpin-helix domain-containing protein [Halomonas sp. Bachu 37]|uniref:helix-hairpin-helix domain-containing protein n=1 Tax=Halomonas kashgarensis TaxID=3084920 RepID=UPI00321737B4